MVTCRVILLSLGVVLLCCSRQRTTAPESPGSSDTDGLMRQEASGRSDYVPVEQAPPSCSVEEARGSVIKWFGALRRKERDGVLSGMAIPFEVRGFDVETSMRGRCSDPTDGRTEAPLTLSADDDGSRARAVECLMADVFLPEAIPERGLAEWSGRAGSDVALGEIREADSRLASPRLARFSARIHRMRPDGPVFEVFLGDGNGITIAAFVGARCKDGHVLVSHLLLDERFED